MKEQFTFILVHGAWHGGWCWEKVAKILKERQHKVFTPTQTGLGEKAHLMSKEITLDTFINDVSQVIIDNELTNVILVGHSFGGNAISGIADQMPSRVKKLIYLDAMLVESGRTPLSTLSASVIENRIQAAQDFSEGLSLPIPPAHAMGITDETQAQWIAKYLTPHPFSTFTSTLNLKNPIGNGKPLVYIVCNDPIYKPLEKSRELAKSMGWPMTTIATGHDAMVSAPQELAELLEQQANTGIL